MESEEESGDIPQDINLAEQSDNQLISKRSRYVYDNTFHAFLNWQTEKKVENNFTESVLLDYFNDLTKKYSPTSLWSKYSMVKSEIALKHDVDISKYQKLQEFLRNNSKGYEPKKARIFSDNQILRFLREAKNEQYLHIKVVCIFGVLGACRSQELANLRLNDVKVVGDMYIVTIRVDSSKKSRPRSFTVSEENFSIVDTYVHLRKQTKFSDRFFLQMRNMKCTHQPIGKLTISKMPSVIAAFLGLKEPEKYTGHSFRRTSASVFVVKGGEKDTQKQHGGWKSSSVIAEGYNDQSLNHKRKVEAVSTSNHHRHKNQDGAGSKKFEKMTEVEGEILEDDACVKKKKPASTFTSSEEMEKNENKNKSVDSSFEEPSEDSGNLYTNVTGEGIIKIDPGSFDSQSQELSEAEERINEKATEQTSWTAETIDSDTENQATSVPKPNYKDERFFEKNTSKKIAKAKLEMTLLALQQAKEEQLMRKELFEIRKQQELAVLEMNKIELKRKQLLFQQEFPNS